MQSVSITANVVSSNPALVLDTILCDKVCQWLAAGRWIVTGTSGSATNKTDRYNVTEILLKVALNTVILTLTQIVQYIHLYKGIRCIDDTNELEQINSP